MDTDFRLDDRLVQPELNRIHGPDGVVDVEPKTMQVLLHLVERSGHVVSADELIDAVWMGRPMGDNPVYKCIAKLRKALGDTPTRSRYIATVPKKGYRILHAPSLEPAAALRPAAVPHTTPAHQPVDGVRADAGTVAATTPPMAAAAPDRRLWWLAAMVVAVAVLGLAGSLYGPTNAPKEPTRPGPEPTPPIAQLTTPVVDVNDGTIAVMVFEDLAGDADHPDLGDGISDEIRTQLARVRGLSVTSRSASLGVRANQLGATQLRDALGVAWALEGTVRVVDERLHYTAQLIDTGNGFQHWSASATRDYDDVLTVQNEIALAVVDALRTRLALGLDGPVANTDSVRAWEAYLRGRNFLSRSFEPEFMDAAEQHFQEALSHDSTYARAHAGLCEVQRRRYRRSGNVIFFERAEAECRTAAELDPQQSEVWVSLGHLYRSSGRPDAAWSSYERARSINANEFAALTGMARLRALQERDAEAEALYEQAIDEFSGIAAVYARYAVHLYRRGRYDEALPHYESAYRLGATNTSIVTALGACYFMLGDFETAERKFRESLAQRPSPNAYTNLGTTYFYLARFDEAIEQYRAALDLSPADHGLWSNLAAGLRQLPDTAAEVQDVCRQAVELGEQELTVNPDDAEVMSRIASCRALLGDRDTARTAVERAAALSPQETNVLFNSAVALVDLDEPVAAARMLERAFEHGYPVSHAQADPMLRPALPFLQL